jgi:3-oxoacyl-[acyl-carrier protein] reductase
MDQRPVALVTGGARGIGRAIAVQLAADGHDIVIVDLLDSLATKSAAALTREHGVRALAFHADVQDHALARTVLDRTIGEFGRIDVLVNNAGISQPKRFLELSEADWDLTIDVHLKGAFNYAHAAVPHMLGLQSGNIVCISSVSAKTGGGDPGVSKTAYAAAKAGLLGFVRGLARELAPSIRVNAVCPGLIATDLTAAKFGSGPAREQALATVPAGRIGLPTDIADIVSFLVSDRASYITGEVIDVNGGSYID